MSVPKETLKDTRELDQIIELKKRSANVHQWRRIEAVWLKQTLKLSNQKIAGILNYKPQTVSFIWYKWKNNREEFFSPNPPGGRNRAYLSPDEEKRFIQPFLESVKMGGPLNVRQVKSEYESLIGKEVAVSTIYRLLYRHGWKPTKE